MTTSSSRPLLPSEVVNALRYSGHYEGDRLAAASDSFAAHGIDLRPFADAGAVTRVAEAVDVPVYDASYVALAAEVDGRAYTADDTLLAAIEDTAYGDRWPTFSGTGNPSVFPSGLKPE